MFFSGKGGVSEEIAEKMTELEVHHYCLFKAQYGLFIALYGLLIAHYGLFIALCDLSIARSFCNTDPKSNPNPNPNHKRNCNLSPNH